MTQKEKANDLVTKFMRILPYPASELDAKNCAIAAAREIKSEVSNILNKDSQYEKYWTEVIKEISK